MVGRPVQAKCPAPIVADQHDLAEVEGVEPGIQVAGVVGEAVGDIGLAPLSPAEREQLTRLLARILEHTRRVND